MTHARRFALAAAVCALAGLVGLAQRRESAPQVTGPTPSVRALSFPVAFEENRGQFDPAVRFVARTDGGVVFAARGEIVFAGGPRPVRMHVDGADEDAAIEGVHELPGRANYFYGKDPNAWRTDVPTFARFVARGVQPGVDLVGRFEGRRFEYDLVVAPGADPSALGLTFDGADRVDVDPTGDLVVRVGDWEMRQRRPAVYQDAGGARRAVECAWVVDGRDHAAFALAGYDASRALCIDPAVIYASYLGGSGGDYGRAVTHDAGGAFYVAGRTASANFPVHQAFQTTYGGAGGLGLGDAFVAELDSSGSSIVFATYLGGNGDDEARGIAVDATGVYVCGRTDSTAPQFPTTVGAIQTAQGLGSDMFVAKLAPTGNALLYSTLIDGGATDEANALVIDSSQNAYVVGQAGATATTTVGAFQTAYGGGSSDAWIGEVNSTGSAFVWATYLGGAAADVGKGIALDGTNVTYVTGSTASTAFPMMSPRQGTYGGGASDAFVAALNVGGTALVYSTYLGGTGRDYGNAIAAASFGNATVVGYTDSTDLPANAGWTTFQGGASDAFVASYNALGQMTFTTYFGGTGADEALGIWMDDTASPWITGVTNSPSLPAPSQSISPRSTPYGLNDAFLVHLAACGCTPLFDTYQGGAGDDTGYAVTVVGGNAFAVGSTTSTNVGATNGAAQTAYGGAVDVFVGTQPPAGGGGGGTTPIDAFFLPKSVTAKIDAKHAEKSSLTVSGFFDTGSKTVDLTAAATLDFGSLHVAIPNLTASKNGKQFKHAAAGLTFTIVPAPTGSSKATFTLKRAGDLSGLVPQDGDVVLHFKNAATDATGEVKLTKGKYAFGKVRGALVKPNLYPASAKATVKGGGKDALTLVVGLATNGQTPASASDLTVKFGATYSVTVPAAKFDKKGDRFLLKKDAAIAGLTTATLDYVKETITVKCKSVDLGAFVDGANSVEIDASLGADSRAVVVRAVKKKTALSY